MITQIFHEVQQYNSTVAYLKSHSPYWPDYYRQEWNSVMYLSTLLRMKFGDTWHTVHHVQSAPTEPAELFNEGELVAKLSREVYLCQYFFVPNPDLRTASGELLYDVDPLQIDEKDRLKIV